MDEFPSALANSSPIVVGGTGGSGTRVLRSGLAAAGVDMGTWLNQSGDAMAFEEFLDAAINQILSVTGGLDYELARVPADLRHGLECAFRACVIEHRRHARSAAPAWGWKNPRTIFILPLIFSIFPRMRFIHVVRDGRDMALSENLNQLRKHGKLVIGDEQKDSALAAAHFWSVTNLQVAAYGARKLGPAYYCVRFEDLCERPQETWGALIEWLGVPSINREAAIGLVTPPRSIGRWRNQAPATIMSLRIMAGPGLTKFGYV